MAEYQESIDKTRRLIKISSLGFLDYKDCEEICKLLMPLSQKTVDIKANEKINIGKATNVELIRQLKFIGISSPTYDDVEPFVWSRSDFAQLSHLGHPHQWRFGPVTNDWKFFDGKPLPGASVSMSSYPGTLWSVDDFYLISSGLAATETTIVNYNQTLYKLYVKPKGTLLTWVRVLLGNRLATKASEWASYLKKFNSGTYNNQWMVVNYNKFVAGQKLGPGVFHLLQLMPGFTHDEDMSMFLNKQGYWPSYNIPFFKDIFNVSGNAAQQTKFGDYFSYDKAPRALIFKRDWKNVTDMQTLQQLIRYNNFRHDPLSRCNCTPPYSAQSALSARADLNPANGTYPFKDMGPGAWGGTDMKATNVELIRQLKFIGISSPTYDDVEPFVWSRSDFAQLSHLGHPDQWRFGPVTNDWKFFGKSELRLTSTR